MAVVYASIGPVMGAGAPVYACTPRSANRLNSTASSQIITGLQVMSGDYARITSLGGAVSVLIGANPTAVAGAGYVVADGATLDVGPLSDADQIAVIDV